VLRKYGVTAGNDSLQRTGLRGMQQPARWLTLRRRNGLRYNETVGPDRRRAEDR
jgi:hypothetical protein